MKTLTLIIAIFWLGLCLEAFAHGRSPEMIRELNAPVPDWMSVAEPIKAEPIEDQSLPASYSFRPRSGGATNSRNRVQIPERGIEFQVLHEIDWRGINEEGYGVSLNTDGTKLVVNTGMTSRLYEITSDGEHREVPIRLPHVTYDEGLKGFITGWSWAGNDVLVGRAEITDETGDEIIEGRLYVFHMGERALARLDLSALNLSDNAGLEVASIGENLEHLRVRVGDREFAVKADLKSPLKVLAKPNPTPAPEMQPTAQSPEPIKSPKAGTTQVEEQSSSPPWPVVAAVVMAALGLLWVLLKKRE
ncbi:MAG: hypothetical protein KDN22_20255 [Verrucomicrobiae bacterium]|nr:hypothetical protein [Verrucomicrobiae bacterium]